MTAQSKTIIKTYFETGDKPTQSEFVNLIDSYQDAATNLGTLSSASLGTVGLQILSCNTSASAQSIIGGLTTPVSLANGGTGVSAATNTGLLTALGALPAANPSATGLLTVTGSANISDKLVMGGGAINEALGANISAGAVIDLVAITGNTVKMTANNTINSIAINQGNRRLIDIQGTPTFTHNPPAIACPGNANIVCVSGDMCEVVGINGGAKIFNYQRVSAAP